MRKFMLDNLKSGLGVLALFIMVGVVALLFGFKAHENNKAAKQSSKTYYHYAASSDFKTDVPLPEEYIACQEDDAAFCTVTYTGPLNDLPSVSSFAEGSIPPAATGVTLSTGAENRAYVAIP